MIAKNRVISFLFLFIFLIPCFPESSSDFNFSGNWADEAYAFKETCNEFLSIAQLNDDQFLIIWNGFDNDGHWANRSLAKKISSTHLIVDFIDVKWTIEGTSDYENGELVYEGLIMYVDPNSEGIIGFDRVQNIDPDYLVPEAER